MAHQACRKYEEDLALLAGGDLPAGDEAPIRNHLHACADCRSTLDALTADLELLSNVDLLPGGLADEAEACRASVVAELTRTEAAVLRPSAGQPAALGRSVDQRATSIPLVAALAAGLLVGAVLLLGPQAPTGEAVLTAQAELPASGEPDYLPVRVSRGAGGVELTWQGDGREAAGGGTYRVLASASPRDFTGTVPLEVAGKRMVATASLPSQRFGDRGVTYFRVQ